jgi:cytochrome c biogenesis protein CcmG, thiol:disulfide interchange protein DsbE
MRRILLLLLSLSFFLSFHVQADELPLNVGGTAPNWTLQTIQSESLDYYQDSEEKVSVIIFWATWCPYCATLMPQMEIIHRKYRSKGVKFYAVDIFEDGKVDPKTYFENRGFTYTMLLEGDDVAKAYGVKGTPGVYVVDKEKKVVYKRPSGVSDVLVKQNVDLRIKQALAK